MAKHLFSVFFLIPYLLLGAPRFLHLSFHKTCLSEMAYIGKELGISIDSKEMLSCPKEEFDGVEEPWSSARYAITQEMADAIWKNNEAYFQSFDGYIVSDTAPLSRIFYHNAPKKPLIIWICNRFDFWFTEKFPDQTYYAQFKKMSKDPNVHMIAWSPYEIAHCKHHFNIGIPLLIKPIGLAHSTIDHPLYTNIPSTVDKPTTLFVRPYGNEKSLDVPGILTSLNIPHYYGYYNGPKDLAGFKGAIHIPLATSNFFLFEYFSLGLIPFIPTKQFYLELSKNPLLRWKLWCKPITYPGYNDLFNYSEWYAPEHKHLIVFFDSWDDLKRKIEKTNYLVYSRRLKAFSKAHKQKSLSAWHEVFNLLMLCKTD